MISGSVLFAESVLCSCIVTPAYGRAFLFMYKVLMEGIVGKRMGSTSLDADVINFLGIMVKS
ncbi:MAG: hypothetical protein K6E88_10505 [Lachnospiraceae bacterium]|nr:hypothetical protein [Lachnospiraceae bacterium]